VYDRRILVLSFIRGIELFSISLLVIIIPVFISDQIIIEHLLSQTIFNINITEEILVGIALSMSLIISSFATPIFGIISDKIKRPKRMIYVGFSILLFSTPLYLIIESYYSVLALRSIQGIAGAIIVPVTLSMINSYSESKKGESFGIYNTIRLIGFGIGPIVAGFIITNGPYTSLNITGIDATFYLMMILFFISFLLLFLFIENKTVTNQDTKDNTKLKDVIRTDKFKIVLVFAFATFWLSASINMFATLENEINNRFAQTTAWFGIQFSAALLANIVFQTIVGKAIDKHYKKPFILAGFLILIPAISLQGFAINSIQMVILRLFQGLSVALVYIPSLTYVGEISGQNNDGFFLSLMSTAFSLGLAVGPIMSGLLFSIGGFSLPFVTAGLFSIIGLIVIYVFTK